eukprot:UN08008
MNVYEKYGVTDNDYIWRLYFDIATYIDYLTGFTIQTLQTDEILFNINQALLYNPRCTKLFFQKAHILRKSKQLKEATAEYQKILQSGFALTSNSKSWCESAIEDIEYYQKNGYNFDHTYYNYVYDPNWCSKLSLWSVFCVLL